MKDFTVEEISKIVLFYKNKASDLELAYLELQISSAKELEKEKEIANKHAFTIREQHVEDAKSFNKKIEELKKELEKYKTKKTNKKITGK